MTLQDLITFINSIDTETYPELLELPILAGNIDEDFRDASDVENILILRSATRAVDDGIYFRTK